MSDRTPLSRSEWAVMNVLWGLGTATARQVWEASPKLRALDYRTVKTLLDRIAAKEWVEVEKLGRLCRFRPVVSRRSARLEALSAFIEDVLDRSMAPLYLHLAERDDLSEEEAAVIRQRIAELEEGASEREPRPPGTSTAADDDGGDP